jgi:hypothetical protein
MDSLRNRIRAGLIPEYVEYEADSGENASGAADTDEPGIDDAGSEPVESADDGAPDGAGDDTLPPEPPMWHTVDGHVLHLPHWLLRRRRWRRRGRARVRRPSRSYGRGVQRVAQLARGARRLGALRNRRSGRRYPVFRSRMRGRNYRITTRPRGRFRHEIIAIQEELGGDAFEVLSSKQPGAVARSGGQSYRVRGAQVRIDWHGPLTVRNAARKHGHGVYIVYRDNKPLYVGETNSFRRRWFARLQVLENLGIDPAPFSVWVGQIKQAAGPKVSDELLRLDVEHVLVRYLLRMARATLTNRKPRNELMAAPLGIMIHNHPKAAPWLPQAIRLRAGEILEIGRLDV